MAVSTSVMEEETIMDEETARRYTTEDYNMISDMLDAEHEAGGHRPHKEPVPGCIGCTREVREWFDEEEIGLT